MDTPYAIHSRNKFLKAHSYTFKLKDKKHIKLDHIFMFSQSELLHAYNKDKNFMYKI